MQSQAVTPTRTYTHTADAMERRALARCAPAARGGNVFEAHESIRSMACSIGRTLAFMAALVDDAPTMRAVLRLVGASTEDEICEAAIGLTKAGLAAPCMPEADAIFDPAFGAVRTGQFYAGLRIAEARAKRRISERYS